MSLRRQPSRVAAKPSIFINPNIDLFLQQFSQFVRRHIVENKSETVLVAGPPSCGKTKLLEHIFQKIPQDDRSIADRLLIFRLHGLIHSTESCSMQEICSQYQIQTKTADEYPCDNLQILLETMANENKEKNIYFIFVLDHFEQFTYQKLNSILYTLFDAVYLENKGYSILTIAVSSRSDCLELPEKRLKSRFSQIYFILSSPPIDDYCKYILQTYKSKKDIQIDHDLFHSLTNIEQKIIHSLRDSHADRREDHRFEQRLDGCLTHLELLLLLISNQVTQRMDDKVRTRLGGTNDSDDDDNDDDDNTGGIATDTKFTFDQVYHEYSKYVLKNQKYFYEKAVVRKVEQIIVIVHCCVYVFVILDLLLDISSSN
jgi:energy-coupling factor transporter ATP-binding protein EcfA2